MYHALFFLNEGNNNLVDAWVNVVASHDQEDHR